LIAVLQATAATHGDEARIPDLGEDHQFANLSAAPTTSDESVRMRAALRLTLGNPFCRTEVHQQTPANPRCFRGW
jgi:hypothetical protein